MFTGLTLLTWLVGLLFLYGCYLLACAITREATPGDAYCSEVDAEFDAQDANDHARRLEARL